MHPRREQLFVSVAAAAVAVQVLVAAATTAAGHRDVYMESRRQAVKLERSMRLGAQQVTYITI